MLAKNSLLVFTCGDFNIHVDTISKDSEKFLNCLESCNINQHVHKPTHLHGHTLDLILTPNDSSAVSNVRVSDFISDHALVLGQLDFTNPSLPTSKTVTFQMFHRINMDCLRSDLENCLFVKCPGNTASVLYEQYTKDLKELLDKHTPEVSRTFIKGPGQVLRTVLHSDRESVLPSHQSKECLANHFVTYFSEKITKIRDSFSSTDPFSLPAPSDLPSFDSFNEVSDEEIQKAIMKSPTKSCLLDPWPTFLVKECLDILVPSITKLVNCSLSEGVVPADCKKTVVTPLIKKSSLPPDNLKNYRPVSGLCFISKLAERVVASQLNDYVCSNGLENVKQSAYKLGHSTETALLSIKNDVHLALARGEATAVVLLDQSAAFDTIDHGTLLGCLSSWFGVSGVVLEWFKSYLSDHLQCVKIGSILSGAKKLLCGVPQGSVLGPILFSLYTTPLCKVIRNHPGIGFHFYADDTYVHLTDKNVFHAFDRLERCLEESKSGYLQIS